MANSVDLCERPRLIWAYTVFPSLSVQICTVNYESGEVVLSSEKGCSSFREEPFLEGTWYTEEQVGSHKSCLQLSEEISIQLGPEGKWLCKEACLTDLY